MFSQTRWFLHFLSFRAPGTQFCLQSATTTSMVPSGLPHLRDRSPGQSCQAVLTFCLPPALLRFLQTIWDWTHLVNFFCKPKSREALFILFSLIFLSLLLNLIKNCQWRSELSGLADLAELLNLAQVWKHTQAHLKEGKWYWLHISPSRQRHRRRFRITLTLHHCFPQQSCLLCELALDF